MVRSGLALIVIVALAAQARSADLARRMGMYGPSGSALAMLDSHVRMSVHGPIAEATITQTFRNDSDRAVEATYIFPLPDDAAVSAMEIDYGSRVIHAAIVKRDEAKRRYEDAVAAGVGGAMLEQERPDVFTQTVTAIPAHGSVAVTLRYDTVARYHAGGEWQLVLPMVVAPRYVPGAASGRATTGTGHAPDTDRAPDASRVTPVAAPGAGGRTDVELAFADTVDDVTSPSHELGKTGDGYKFFDEHSDHDAIVRWRAKLPETGWVEQDDDGGYAAVVVEAPPAAARKTAVRALVVLDRAATTRGDADAVARPVVRGLFAAMTAQDSVAVAGGMQIDWGVPEVVAQKVEAGWGKQNGALDLAKVLAATRARGSAVVLVSDGLVADDRAVLAAARQVGGPIHVLGIGQAPNRSLLEGIAAATGGTVRFAVAGDDVAVLARSALVDAATPPPLLTVSWSVLSARDVVPAQLPRLGAGQAVLVVARVDKLPTANARPNVRARGDVFALGTIATTRAPAGATTAKGPLARRWARMKLDELIAAGDRGAIAIHALRYGLVSPATTMVAIGDEVIVQGGVKHTVSVPVSVPAGMHWQAVKKELEVDTGGADKPAEKPADRVAVTDTKSRPKTEPRPEPKQPVRQKTPEKKGETQGSRGENKPVVVTHGGEHRVPVAAGPSGGAAGRVVGGDATSTTTGSSRPVQAEPPPPPTADARPNKTAKDKEESDDEDASGRSRDLAPRAAPAPDVAMREDAGEAEEAVSITSYESARARRRLRLSVAAGAAVVNGASDVLVAPRASFEVGQRTRFGVEGSLWLVGNLDVQGTLLGTVSRIAVLRHLDLLAGLGLHLGDAPGPAGAVELRLRLPLPHVGMYLRYDGALLFHDKTRDGQNAGTIGVETSF